LSSWGIDSNEAFHKWVKTCSNSSVPQFDRFCDIEESVQAIAPVESCESSCITIFEPQYFGGLRSPHRPYLFLRGCSSRLLSAMESPPREIDFLHRAAICVSLPLSQIYPKVYTNEVVEVGGYSFASFLLSYVAKFSTKNLMRN
uniref:Actin-related protein 5 n=1 Tax=Haemonchus placei TaxID=6290 RepID=A0A0N4W7Y7_HAEPC